MRTAISIVADHREKNILNSKLAY